MKDFILVEREYKYKERIARLMDSGLSYKGYILIKQELGKKGSGYNPKFSRYAYNGEVPGSWQVCAESWDMNIKSINDSRKCYNVKEYKNWEALVSDFFVELI